MLQYANMKTDKDRPLGYDDRCQKCQDTGKVKVQGIGWLCGKCYSIYLTIWGRA